MYLIGKVGFSFSMLMFRLLLRLVRFDFSVKVRLNMWLTLMFSFVVVIWLLIEVWICVLKWVCLIKRFSVIVMIIIMLIRKM